MSGSNESCHCIDDIAAATAAGATVVSNLSLVFHILVAGQDASCARAGTSCREGHGDMVGARFLYGNGGKSTAKTPDSCEDATQEEG